MRFLLSGHPGLVKRMTFSISLFSNFNKGYSVGDKLQQKANQPTSNYKSMKNDFVIGKDHGDVKSA